jgi:hypothetical protein
MKKYAFLISISLVIAGCSNSSNDNSQASSTNSVDFSDTDEGPPGTYALHNFEEQKPDGTKETLLIRLQTTTGACWIYSMRSNEWVGIREHHLSDEELLKWADSFTNR